MVLVNWPPLGKSSQNSTTQVKASERACQPPRSLAPSEIFAPCGRGSVCSPSANAAVSMGSHRSVAKGSCDISVRFLTREISFGLMRGSMARPLRSQYPGAVYHACPAAAPGRRRIMTRGNNAQPVFQHGRDCRLWLASGFKFCPLWSFHLPVTRLLPRHYTLTIRALHACRPPQFFIEFVCQIHRSALVFGRSKAIVHA